MTPAALLVTLRCRGITVTAELVLTPADAVTPADVAVLRARKAELLTLLADLESLEDDGTAALWRRLHGRLSEDERGRLAREVAAGDPLAERIALALNMPALDDGWDAGEGGVS